jgi:hypothetical protein
MTFAEWTAFDKEIYTKFINTIDVHFIPRKSDHS